jgi:hypothetical protein
MTIEAVSQHIDKEFATRKEVKEACAELGLSHVKILEQLEKVKRGLYRMTTLAKVETPVENKVVELRPKQTTSVADTYVPPKDPCFVPFGEFSTLDKVIASRKFMPVLITGESGNGKSAMVKQACAKNKRAFYRLNITVETDTLDLLGHYNLVNGNTVWQDSPLVEAARTGGIVLLDEIFAANPARILALQGILEGEAFIVKQTGERIIPAPGFNIIATDNSRGDGSESGKYIGVNIQNFAFLERFAMCIDHDFPSRAKELKMLEKYVDYHNIVLDDSKFLDNLCQFAEVTRKSYKDEAIDEQISTRRLFHVLDIYAVLDDKMKAINFAIARFDTEIKDAFLSLYKKIDDSIIDPNHQPVDLDNGIHIPIATILEQVTDENKDFLVGHTTAGVIDLTLTKSFIEENISMLIPDSQQVYEFDSKEYSEIKNKILMLLTHGVRHGTSNLNPGVIISEDPETDVAIQQARDAVEKYDEMVEDLKVKFTTPAQNNNSHGPASVLDQILKSPEEEYESIKDLIRQQGES